MQFCDGPDKGTASDFVQMSERSATETLAMIRQASNVQTHRDKEFALEGQAFNSAHYCEILLGLRENVQRLRLEIWRQNNFLLHHGNAPFHTSFFTKECLTKNNMTVVPHPPCFSLFPRLKIKLKGNHSDTNEATEAESQAKHPHRTRLPGCN
jgi:hypothetical protein